ncbi:MAG TPA: BON domain-containing protein [Kofleriaceae bacterium]|jgi:osmotically-inducible protein OsmY
MTSFDPPIATSDEVLAAIRAELASVPLPGVHATQYLGVIVLTGAAPTWAGKVAAQDAAFRVAGVRDVANAVAVGEYAEDPSFAAVLASEARRALDADPRVVAGEIHVLACDRVITLRGAVDTHPQREAAWHAVRRLGIARTVRDELAVVDPAVTPDELRDAIETALGRHVAREARRLQIVIDGREVIVHGLVQSAAEKAAVLGAVKATPGVAQVRDCLVVAPSAA